MTITACSHGSPHFRHTGNAHFLTHKCLTLSLNNALLMYVAFSYTYTHTGRRREWELEGSCFMYGIQYRSFGSWHYTDRYSDGNFRFKSSSNHCGAKSTLLNCFILVVESVQADDLREEKNVS